MSGFIDKLINPNENGPVLDVGKILGIDQIKTDNTVRVDNSVFYWIGGIIVLIYFMFKK